MHLALAEVTYTVYVGSSFNHTSNLPTAQRMDTIMSDTTPAPSASNNNGNRFEFGRRPSEGELNSFLTTLHMKIDLLDAKVDETTETLADRLDALATQMDLCADKSDLDAAKDELNAKLDRREARMIEVDVSFREIRALSRAWRKPREAMFQAALWAWSKAGDLVILVSRGVEPYLSPGLIVVVFFLVFAMLAAGFQFGTGSVAKLPNEAKVGGQEPAWSKIRSEVHQFQPGYIIFDSNYNQEYIIFLSSI
ncbi:hypothetical protein K474DRAFT_1712546 [Panus rudis PR-1116 ss-1]|nr:hypothetical protein K474DRAFT_1712546 [Panus rudis PR-1116 ss-1]